MLVHFRMVVSEYRVIFGARGVLYLANTRNGGWKALCCVCRRIDERESRLVRHFGEAMALDWDTILVTWCIKIWSRWSCCLFYSTVLLVLLVLSASAVSSTLAELLKISLRYHVCCPSNNHDARVPYRILRTNQRMPESRHWYAIESR